MKEVDALLEKLKAELKEVSEQLAFYVDRKDRLEEAIGGLELLSDSAIPVRKSPPQLGLPIQVTATGTVTPSVQSHFIQRVVPTSLVGSAELVLMREGKPLHSMEIVKRVQEMGLRPNDDPEAVRNSLVPSLERKAGKGDTFVRVAPGTYGLIAFEK